MSVSFSCFVKKATLSESSLCMSVNSLYKKDEKEIKNEEKKIQKGNIAGVLVHLRAGMR